MAKALKDHVELSISMTALESILTDALIDTYGVFSGMVVAEVAFLNEGPFALSVTLVEPENVMAPPTETIAEREKEG